MRFTVIKINVNMSLEKYKKQIIIIVVEQFSIIVTEDGKQELYS